MSIGVNMIDMIFVTLVAGTGFVFGVLSMMDQKGHNGKDAENQRRDL